MNCSTPCECQPDDPPIATPKYAALRRHVDAGDLDGLRLVTQWLEDGEPQCHVRYADGEFNSIMRIDGANADGQDFKAGTLPHELSVTLWDIAHSNKDRVLVGGNWERTQGAWEWLTSHGLHQTIPWCPAQVFISGIISGELLRFLQILKGIERRKFLVTNYKIAKVAHSIGAMVIIVPMNNAYYAMPYVEKLLGELLADGDVVLYASGLGSKQTIWRMYSRYPSTSHIDVGTTFDGAAGVVSRSWLEDSQKTRDWLQPNNEGWARHLSRLQVYHETITPFCAGK